MAMLSGRVEPCLGVGVVHGWLFVLELCRELEKRSCQSSRNCRKPQNRINPNLALQVRHRQTSINSRFHSKLVFVRKPAPVRSTRPPQKCTKTFERAQKVRTTAK